MDLPDTVLTVPGAVFPVLGTIFWAGALGNLDWNGIDAACQQVDGVLLSVPMATTQLRISATRLRFAVPCDCDSV
jgi:hypothetical protein